MESLLILAVDKERAWLAVIVANCVVLMLIACAVVKEAICAIPNTRNCPVSNALIWSLVRAATCKFDRPAI